MEDITIRHGNEYMKCNQEGFIYRPEIKMMKPSGQWKIVGAVRYNNFGYPVEYFDLNEVLHAKIQWKFKNGKQRVHVQDFDHGTYRVWMSPTHEVRHIPYYLGEK